LENCPNQVASELRSKLARAFSADIPKLDVAAGVHSDSVSIVRILRLWDQPHWLTGMTQQDLELPVGTIGVRMSGPYNRKRHLRKRSHC
jgi:hypothetical protein